MKTIALILALVASACAPSAQPQGHHLGLNLGKQLAAITLLSGSNNNVAIAPNGNTTTMLRFSTNSSGSTISGMDATTVSDGDWFIVRNEATTGQLTLTNEDTNSLAANRFHIAGAVSLVLDPGGSAFVEYDVTLSRWWASMGQQAAPTVTGAASFTSTATFNGTLSQVNKGNVVANGSAIPVLTSCGTSPSITAGSTDFAGNYTTGSAATTCTITFANAFTNAPDCLILNSAGAATLIPTYTVSASAITVSVDIASTLYRYICVGH